MTRAVPTKALCRLLLPAACLLVAACANRPGLNAPDSTRATATPGPPSTSPSTNTGKEKAITAYRNHLERYPNNSEHDNITRRLADLLVEKATDIQLALITAPEEAARLQAEARQAYAEAINYYEYLLKKNPHAADGTELLYQLSRAYDESGQPGQALAAIERLLARDAESDMRLYADTLFRQAELLFGDGDYRQAGESYQAVIDLGESVPAHDQALYKLGWSLFKQERYPEALQVSSQFLDRKIPPGEPFDAQSPRLSPAVREQLADVFRVISMSFAQLNGVESVGSFFKRNGSRGYEANVYLGLADLYVEQGRISEAARTWLALARLDPLDPGAPRLTAQALNQYREAGFQPRVVETETLFVQEYGTGSTFWTVHRPEDFPDVMRELQLSLQDLAHISREEAHKTQIAEDVRQAEYWYRQYLASFGDEEDAGEMNYQLAEMLYGFGRFGQAVEEYERAAWSRGTHPRSAEAALGAQYAIEKLLSHADAADKAALTERATTGALRFVKSYPDHPAAPELLARGGTVLLEQQRHETALRSSEQVLAEAAAAPPEIRQVAWSIRAQALFAIEDYQAATAAYREALGLAGKDDPRRPVLQEGLATATYKHARQAWERGDSSAAIALYQQAARLAPLASIRSVAQYDAATALLAQESWVEAIRILEQFRRDHANDPLQQEVSRKLAYAYDRNGDISQAASEYLRLGRDRRQAEKLQREALLRAADLYRQTGAVREAISTRELYLKRFPEPAVVAVDVMQQLAELESDDNNNLRRQYWLKEIVRLDRVAGNSRTRALAARAALEMAENRLNAFYDIRLVNPVKDNLARKLKAMKQALREFEAVIDYGVSTVTPAATHQIGSLYYEMSRALLTSEQPKSLTAEELAEYEVLLAEQAAPFTQQAIDVYSTNVRRSSGDALNPWVEKSAQRLVELQQHWSSGATADAN